jgi:glycosyltransferase involved in cell wall biosynthesis
MKLGIISSMAASPWGGSEELWVALAERALSEKLQVSASVFDWGELPAKIKNLKGKGASIHLRSRISYTDIKGKLKGKLVKILFAEKQLGDFVKRENPDVLFVSLGAFCDLEIDSLRSFLLTSDIPFYLVVHSNNESFTIDPLKFKKLREVCSRAKMILFVSDRLRKQSERQIAYDFRNSDIVINPVNMTQFGKLPPTGFREPVFACVGTIQTGVKGQGMLLQILGNAKWRERNWKLNIYGRGPDEGLIKELIDFYGLQKKVFLKGYASDIRNEIWAMNDLLLMPSFIEGMPISLVEAMLCGRPAVVTDVGGNRELVSDEETGFLAEGANPFSFERAMERAWKKREEWESMGERACLRAAEIYKQDPTDSLLKIITGNDNN